MPNEPTTVSKPDYREIGATGTKIFTGLISEETVPQLRGQNAYRSYQGMRFDATCSALYKSIELPIRSARWYVEPASDKEEHVNTSQFVHDILWEFGTQSMDDVVRLGLEMIPFGFSVLEVLWEYIEEGPWKGKVGWSELAYRSQATKWRWNLDWVNGRRQLVSMTQLAPPFYAQTDIPRNKFLLWVHEQEGHNFDGWPAFRVAWKDFWIRDQLYRVRGIGLERAYMGIPKATIPAEFSDEMRDLARQIVETLRVDEQAGVIVPENLGLDILFNHLQERGMNDAILFHNRQILLSQLAQFLDLGSGQAGAFSLSSDHSELFLQACNSRANYFAEQLNLEPGVASLVRLNFPNVTSADLPRVQHGDIGQRALETLGRTMMALAQFGFITPDDATEDRFRQMLDLPEREESIDDRELFDLISEVHPSQSYYGVPANPRVAGGNPLAAPQQAGAPAGTVAPPKPGQQAPAGGAKAAKQETAAMAENRAKLAEAMTRRRWPRVTGRPTEAQRLAMKATENVAAALDDFYATASYNRHNRPESPRARVARLRRPYEVQHTHTHSEVQQLAPGQRRVWTRQMALAQKYQRRLAPLLLPQTD